jgi:hypothetical protein
MSRRANGLWYLFAPVQPAASLSEAADSYRKAKTGFERFVQAAELSRLGKVAKRHE